MSDDKIVRFPEDCRVERTDPAVLTITVPMPTAQHRFHLLFQSDSHWDSTHNDWDTEQAHLELIKSLHGAIVHGGDLNDAMQGKDDKRRSKRDGKKELELDDDYPDTLVDRAIARYAPYAANFAAMGWGNHETSALKHLQTKLIDRIAGGLNDRHGGSIESMGYSFFVRLKFIVNKTKRETLDIFVFHGKGGGAEVTRGAIDQHRLMAKTGADIYFLGHKHKHIEAIMSREHLSHDGRLVIRPSDFLQVVGYKTLTDPMRRDWASQGGHTADPSTAVLLTFKPNKQRQGNRGRPLVSRLIQRITPDTATFF